MNFKTMVCPEDSVTTQYGSHATHATLEMSAQSVGGAELSGEYYEQHPIATNCSSIHNLHVCILCHLSQEWTKLERAEGAPWPAERSSHAACCLNYGQDHPQVLVTGGADKNGNALSDMWILDVQSGRWREVSGDVHTNVWLVQSQHYLSLQFYSIWTN